MKEKGQFRIMNVMNLPSYNLQIIHVGLSTNSKGCVDNL